MHLYTYFRSSAAYRVRIGLALKGLSPEPHFVDLREGHQHASEYRALNPQGLVPLLLHDGLVLGQSLAILEYLDEIAPTPPLLPAEAAGRARVRSLAYAVACEIHPLQNLRVQKYLVQKLGRAHDEVLDWVKYWITTGLDAVEALVATHPATGRFCHGSEPTLADVCLVPQLANADRYGCWMPDAWPTLTRIRGACAELEAFRAAEPSRQPDAV